MAAPRKYPDELRERAIRLVLDARAEPGASAKGACQRIGAQLGISPETLRVWVAKAEVDAGTKAGVPTEVAARLAELERENRELRRANEILKSASAFFAAELCATRRRDNRGGVGDPLPLGCRSSLVKPGGSLTRRNAGEGGKRPRRRQVAAGLPDGAGLFGKVRRCNGSEPVVEAP
ncbi:transposase [Parafrankia soli]|uniref:transposase n=1 Tax=Parafrankia soli TaxID=2599596 RepID=UPI0009F18998|nr:transposase [Parafrankia soli]